jgi:hypothetical protein
MLGIDTPADSAGRGGTVVGMATHPLLIVGVAVGAVDADASAWIAVVHQVAHELDAAVIGQAEHPGPGRNHCRVRIRSASGTWTRLLLNAVGRLVAASNDPDPGELTVAFSRYRAATCSSWRACALPVRRNWNGR